MLDRINQVFDPFLRQGLLNQVYAGMISQLPGCPSATPEDFAYSFVRAIEAPGPDPWIAPGHAITGKASFLETRAPTTTPRRYDTPIGPMEVTLRATSFVVDWGDGTAADDGPFASPGKPWPDGSARHTYTSINYYDVVVTQMWDADWQLAGDSGTIHGLTSEGRIDDFEARQLQAVLNR